MFQFLNRFENLNAGHDAHEEVNTKITNKNTPMLCTLLILALRDPAIYFSSGSNFFLDVKISEAIFDPWVEK
jgi:hypothetical protein